MKLLPMIIVAIVISGCATAYQPIGATGGFYHQKVAENAYIIGFRGNGFTNHQRTNDFARLRAAEIGHKLGFTHFVIDGMLDKSQTQLMNMGSTTTTSGNLYSSGSSASFYGTSRTTNDTMPVHKPGVEIGILYSEGVPQGRHLEVFVVQDVLNELKAKYKITP